MGEGWKVVFFLFEFGFGEMLLSWVVVKVLKIVWLLSEAFDLISSKVDFFK